MGVFRVRRSSTGFTFENRVTSLLTSLQFNVKGKVEFDCVISSHLVNEHEFDRLADFLTGRNHLLPSYASEFLAVSCKKTLNTPRLLETTKDNLLKAIDCYKSLTGIAPKGLIITSSIMPLFEPNLNDGIYFWDLSRCFFYGWKSYFVNRLKVSVNYYEQKLFGKSTFVLGSDDPGKDRNICECEIFFDETDALDCVNMERSLKKILSFISHDNKIEEGLVYVNVHTIKGFHDQVLSNKKNIEKIVSTNKIKFEIINIYDYSVVPWDPITMMSSKTYSGT